MKNKVLKKESKKGLFNLLKSLDNLILFGILTNFGIVIVAIVFLGVISSIIKIDLQTSLINISIVYVLFSIGIYFAIGKSKSFKIGYVLGFVLIIIGLIKGML